MSTNTTEQQHDLLKNASTKRFGFLRRWPKYGKPVSETDHTGGGLRTRSVPDASSDPLVFSFDGKEFSNKRTSLSKSLTSIVGNKPPQERPVVGFDVDGTLIDSAKALLILLQEYVMPKVNDFTAKKLKALTEDDVRDIQATESLTKYMMKELGFSKEELKLTLELTARYGPDVYRQHTTLKPGAHELVRQIERAGYLPIPITNNFGAVVSEALEAHGLFSKDERRIVSRSDDIRPKPAPDGLLLAAQFGNGTIAYHIGDSPDDCAAAQAASLKQGSEVNFIRVTSSENANGGVGDAVRLSAIRFRTSFLTGRRRTSSILRHCGLPDDLDFDESWLSSNLSSTS